MRFFSSLERRNCVMGPIPVLFFSIKLTWLSKRYYLAAITRFPAGANYSNFLNQAGKNTAWRKN